MWPTLLDIAVNEGGPGSGNFGHAGRPNLRGGSAPRSGIQHLTAKKIREIREETGESDEDMIARYHANPEQFKQQHRLGQPSLPSTGVLTRVQHYPRNPSVTTGPLAARRPEHTDDELKAIVAYALKHENPEIRVRAKSAHALLKSGDTDVQRIGRQRAANLPTPQRETVEKTRQEAVAPFQHVPEYKKGESFTDHTLRTLGYVTDVLDKPRRIAAGALAGKYRELGNVIPFSDTLGITKPEQSTSGRDLLEKWGAVGPNHEGFDWGDVAGFGVDLAIDPLTWAAGAGGVARSAKLGETALSDAARASIKRSASYTARQQVPKWIKAGKTPAQVKAAYKKYYKYAKDQEQAYRLGILAKRANRAKAVYPRTPASTLGRAAKVTEEAVAAQGMKAAKTGGATNPAAAGWVMLKHLKNMPAVGEGLRRLGKHVGRKLGRGIKKVRDLSVPESLLRTTPGIGKVPTTVGQAVSGATKAVTSHPKVVKAAAKATWAAKYANELHQAGRAVQEATEEKQRKHDARYNGPELKATENYSRDQPRDEDGKWTAGEIAATTAAVGAGLLLGGAVGKAVYSSIARKGAGKVAQKATTEVSLGQFLVQHPPPIQYKDWIRKVGSISPKARTVGEVTRKVPLRAYQKLPESSDVLKAWRAAKGEAEVAKHLGKAQVPMMITKGMRAKLTGLGHTEEAIRHMTPKQAWEHLGGTLNSATPLEFLTVNLSGNVRRERWNGKNYLVAPLSLIVEGVLNGSKGPLHYPMTEMQKSCKSWEGTPIVVYHPMDGSGRPQRARGNSEVLNKQGVGTVRYPKIQQPKLVAEGWFDEDKTKKVDQRVYNALVAGQKMELSTGLDTDNETATNGAAWNGRAYSHIAKNYRPDHLAILPDQQGACILPGQEIQGRIVKASKAWYTGEAVRIKTASGVVLSVTANHPILTESGFVPAGQLTKGQYLLNYVGEDKPFSTYDDKENGPALAEKVFESLETITAVKKTGRPCALDFHGDAAFFKGDVEIVNPQGSLRDNRISKATQRFTKSSLRGGSDSQLSLPCGGSTKQSADRMGSANVGFIGNSGKSLAFAGTELGVHQVGCLGIAPSNSCSLDQVVDGSLVDASDASDLVSRFTTDVEGDGPADEFFRESLLEDFLLTGFCVFGSGAELDICLPKSQPDRADVEIKLFRKLLNAFPSKVVPDQIVNVDRFFHDGPVFDFESTTGYIIAEKLIVSNCSLNDGCGLGVTNTVQSWVTLGIVNGTPPRSFRDSKPRLLRKPVKPREEGTISTMPGGVQRRETGVMPNRSGTLPKKTDEPVAETGLKLGAIHA